MAGRGRETLAPRTDEADGPDQSPTIREVKPHAVVQLRQDNALGTLWNIVGFQTKLRHGEQIRVFRQIPGLEGAEFARLGGLHRNTFLNSPKLLDQTLRLRADTRLRFAGQITGVEGYVESAAIGLIAGRFAAAERCSRPYTPPPPTTALGALLAHITGGHLSADGDGGQRSFQPMNVNFGLFPPGPQHRRARPGKAKRGAKALARKQAHVGKGARRPRWVARRVCFSGSRIARREGIKHHKRESGLMRATWRSGSRTLARALR